MTEGNMSATGVNYVKCGVLWRGVWRGFEVRDSELLVDVTRDPRETPRGVEVVELPPFKDGASYVAYCQAHNQIPLGSKKERFEMGLPSLSSEADKDRWLRYLEGLDIREGVGVARGEWECAIDLDHNLLITTPQLSYLSLYLPDDWRHREAKPSEENPSS